MDKTSLGDRMKEYENAYRYYLPKHLPIIVRCDMRAGHTLTRYCDKPFDIKFMSSMLHAAKFLCETVQDCRLAYVQSDEISLLLTNNNSIEAQPWFNNNFQKLISLTASAAAVGFNSVYGSTALFDSRAFILPEDEVNNYFIWRQQDATRNSIQMAAHAYISHKECQNKNSNELQELLFQKTGINWNNYSTSCKRGTCIIKKQMPKTITVNNSTFTIMRNTWTTDENIPIFSQNKEYINKYLKVLNNENV